ncbi:MAG: pantetheine-phosphate adenylyltransferase [Eubacterium sp.]|nr:pantetheine-phosphate adenylyltransferase [Eubacterium sp.]
MRRALYAGSFDPLTCGHENLIRRAAKLCDELVVGVIRNPQKNHYFSQEERVAMISEAICDLDNVTVASFEGLLAEYVNNNGFDMVIRGLRGVSDFDSEIQMAQMNARLYENNVETVFLMTDPEFSFLSSSMAKEVHGLGGSIKGLVPDNVLRCMEAKKK